MKPGHSLKWRDKLRLGVSTLRGICECLNRRGISTRNGKSQIVGYLERDSGNRETLRDKNGRILGRFKTDTGVTRAADGKNTGRGSNQLLKLLK